MSYMVMRGMHRSQSGGTLIETAFLCRNNTDDLVDDPVSNFASMNIMAKSNKEPLKAHNRTKGRRERGQPTIMSRSKPLYKTPKFKDIDRYSGYSTNNHTSHEFDEKEYLSESYCKENINCKSAPCTPPSASLKLVRRLFLSPMESWRTPPSRMKHSPNVWNLGALANNACDELKECSVSSYDSISGSFGEITDQSSQKSSKKAPERRRSLVPSWSRISTLLNSGTQNRTNSNLSRSTSLEINKSTYSDGHTYIESVFAPNQLQSSPTPAATSSTRSTTTRSTQSSSGGTPRNSNSSSISTLSAPKVVLRRKRLKFNSILSPIADKSPDSFNSSMVSSQTAPSIAANHDDEVQDALDVPWEVPKLRNRLKQQKESKFIPKESNLASKNEFKVGHRDSDSGISTTSSQGRPLSLPTTSLLPPAMFRDEDNFYLEENRRSKLFLSFDNKVDCSRLKTLMFLTNSPFDLNDCVQIDPMLDIREQTFYHGKIRREEAELLLKGEPEGTYLVRKLLNSGNPEQFALVVRSSRGFMHLRISNVEGGFEVSALHRVFSSVSAIIHHYSRNRLNIKGAEHLCLKWPLQVQESL